MDDEGSCGESAPEVLGKEGKCPLTRGLKMALEGRLGVGGVSWERQGLDLFQLHGRV